MSRLLFFIFYFLFSFKKNLHDVMMVPHDGVEMKILRRVEPEIDSLFSIAFSMSKYVCLDSVRLSTSVPQELKVQFVSYRVGVRIHLFNKILNKLTIFEQD